MALPWGVTFGAMLVELAEKMGLLAAAALVVVLVPALRSRLLGPMTGEPPAPGRIAAAATFGLLLSAWGAMLGLEISGEHFNVRAIGVLLAALLGGPVAGLLAGLGAGIFYALRVDAGTAPWVLLASVLDGVLAGWIARSRPSVTREPVRAAGLALVVQSVHIVVVGMGLLLTAQANRYLPAWPAHVAKLLVNAAGVGLFVAVARVLVSQQESAGALAKAQADAQRASLQALRRRLEPHFLFNALNAVRATIRRDPDRARELVADLSDLYRYLLTHPEDAALGAEIQHAASYLAIERARLGDDRLTVSLAVEDAASKIEVPALLVQPLVENAVKHGIARHDGPGTIEIAARVVGEDLVLTITNHSEGASLPAIAEGEGREEGAHLALSMLRERLEGRYGSAASLVLAVDGAGASQTVRIAGLARAVGAVESPASTDAFRPASLVAARRER